MKKQLIASVFYLCLADIDPNCFCQFYNPAVPTIDATDSEYQSVFMVAKNVSQEVVVDVNPVKMKAGKEFLGIVLFRDKA